MSFEQDISRIPTVHHRFRLSTSMEDDELILFLCGNSIQSSPLNCLSNSHFSSSQTMWCDCDSPCHSFFLFLPFLPFSLKSNSNVSDFAFAIFKRLIYFHIFINRNEMRNTFSQKIIRMINFGAGSSPSKHAFSMDVFGIPMTTNKNKK